MSARVHPTVDQLATLAGVSRRTMFNAIKVRRNGCDELIAAGIDGSVSLNLALAMLPFDHPSQRLILAELPTIPPKRRLGFIKILLGGVQACTAESSQHGERTQ